MSYNRTEARRALRRAYGLSRPVTDVELDAEIAALRTRPVMDYRDMDFHVASALEGAGVDLESD